MPELYVPVWMGAVAPNALSPARAGKGAFTVFPWVAPGASLQPSKPGGLTDLEAAVAGEAVAAQTLR